MWMNYDTNKELGKRINGITKKQSLKADNASGVVRHPKTGERIYWQS